MAPSPASMVLLTAFPATLIPTRLPNPCQCVPYVFGLLTSVSHPAPNSSPASPSGPMVPLTTQSMRCWAVIGRSASLLLEEDALNDDVSVSDSGTAVDASVPGISFCCAKTTEANKKVEQLSL